MGALAAIAVLTIIHPAAGAGLPLYMDDPSAASPHPEADVAPSPHQNVTSASGDFTVTMEELRTRHEEAFRLATRDDAPHFAVRNYQCTENGPLRSVSALSFSSSVMWAWPSAAIGAVIAALLACRRLIR